ncbi:glutamine--scyllo-inositol aminotransferase [Nitrospira sp. KM1]|nr:glutamine--scyllo-inositol aminotransferase [Nitrospira sp. KM1]
MADPRAEALRTRDALMTVVERVLTKGTYILGEEVEAFEQEWAQYLGVVACVGVANGTDALALALSAVGVSAGDEVITVSHTAVATVAAIEYLGACPVFLDIDPQTRCVDPRLIRSVLSPRTKAIVPVHIYGQPAPMDEILAVADGHGLKVVEDCAQAHGAAINGRKVGTFGHAAAFSFYPTKNLGALGDGGAIVTDDPSIAETLRALRQYGWKRRYISQTQGRNSRLDELQAAVLRFKLPFLEERNQRRRTIAQSYQAALVGTGLQPPVSVRDTLHAMHLFVVESRAREALEAHLRSAGIASARHYPMPVHLQPAYAGRLRGSDQLPITEALYQRILTIPCHPDLEDGHIDRIASALRLWQEPSSRNGGRHIDPNREKHP